MTSSTTSITPEQAAAARRDAKARAERERRAKIAAAREAVETAGIFSRMDGSKILVKVPLAGNAEMTEDRELSTEQRDRAATYKAGHGGLTGNALARYIMTGETARQQVEAARQDRQRVERADRQRSNVTRSADPAATDVAQRARAFAGVKSAFLPKEGRGFLDAFTVSLTQIEESGVDAVKVRRGNAQGVEGALEEVTISKGALVAFAQGAEMDEADKKDVRVKLSGLGKGTVLWGRKLAAFIAVRAEEAR
jgi:hypothetical protein